MLSNQENLSTQSSEPRQCQPGRRGSLPMTLSLEVETGEPRSKLTDGTNHISKLGICFKDPASKVEKRASKIPNTNLRPPYSVQTHACAFTHTHTHTYTQIHYTCTHTYTYPAYIPPYPHTYSYTYIHTYTQSYKCTQIHTPHTYMHMPHIHHIYTHIQLSHICIHIHTPHIHNIYTHIHMPHIYATHTHTHSTYTYMRRRKREWMTDQAWIHLAPQLLSPMQMPVRRAKQRLPQSSRDNMGPSITLLPAAVLLSPPWVDWQTPSHLSPCVFHGICISQLICCPQKHLDFSKAQSLSPKLTHSCGTWTSCFGPRGLGSAMLDKGADDRPSARSEHGIPLPHVGKWTHSPS